MLTAVTSLSTHVFPASDRQTNCVAVSLDRLLRPSPGQSCGERRIGAEAELPEEIPHAGDRARLGLAGDLSYGAPAAEWALRRKRETLAMRWRDSRRKVKPTCCFLR